MVPSKMLAIPNANHFPFAKCDTWFSVCFMEACSQTCSFFLMRKLQEFADHNDNGLILSESAESYIIGNLASYDKRQYPEWLNSNYRPGVNTPEGQGFGHVLVIPKRRIFNIVDPDATAKDASAIRELRDHFKTFWRNGGSPKIVQRARASFDDQNAKLAAKKSTQHLYYQLLPILEADFERLSRMYGQLGVHDLEFAFHAFPDASVGHLHMHVFPKLSELRKFSTRHHDWKTIPIEAVLEVEEEDRRKRRESTEG